MPKLYSSVEVANALGVSPNYVTRFLRQHGVERTLGIYAISEKELERLKKLRASSAKARAA